MNFVITLVIKKKNKKQKQTKPAVRIYYGN